MTEQELIELALDQGIPALQDLKNIEANTAELLELYKAEIEEQKQKELLESEELQTLEVIEEDPEEEIIETEVLSEEDPEEEIIIDYDPLLLEQLEILNAHMEITHDLQQQQNQIGAETAWLLVMTIVIAIGTKVFVDQITRW